MITHLNNGKSAYAAASTLLNFELILNVHNRKRRHKIMMTSLPAARVRQRAITDAASLADSQINRGAGDSKQAQ